MALTRARKKEIIDIATETFKEANVVIVVQNKGMTVAQVSDLRSKMRNSGASYRVVKNRLAMRSTDGTAFSNIHNLLKGPTALATSKDPVAAAKVVVEFAKTNEKLVVVGGAYGDKVLSLKEVEALAKLPSLDELRAKIVGMLQTPAMRIATILQAPGSQVARVISAYSAKG